MTKRASIQLLFFVCIGLLAVPALSQADAQHPSPDTVQTASSVVPTSPTDAAVDTPDLSLAEVDEESQFDVELEGRKTWTVRYGFGHPLGLATSGIAPGQLSLDQTLTADIVGEALSVLSIEAHYNDQLPSTMQSLALYLDTERLDGVVGDFTFAGIPDFLAYSKKMKGLQLELLLGDAVLTAVVSKTEGVSETVVFVGQTAHTEVSYTATVDGAFNQAAPYRQNLEGIAAFPLDVLYTEEFSTLHFAFEPSSSLRSVLSLYEIEYLFDTVSARPQLEMKPQDYRVIEADEQVLLLQRDPAFVIRERLRDLIKLYNEDAGLVGSAAKKYPFIAGTDYELAFLNQVAPFALLVVDDVVYPLDDAQRQRFYDLGHTEVRKNTMLAEISTDGTAFESVDSLRLPDYQAILHEDAGVLECDFPASFFAPTSVLRVAFDYTVSDGAFMLGLSLIPGSEVVTLNSEVQTRDVDYMIDYEVGMLFMLTELTETDVLHIDYELYSGGFGAASDYASYFYGITLDVPLTDAISVRADLLQMADAPGSAADADRVGTMPNRHTVAGIQADFSLDDFTANVLVGYNQDQFPFDDNARSAELNEINAIAVGEGYVLFGHNAGFTVNDGGNWQTYGPESGLSSSVVQAIAVGDGVVYLGTKAGLTVVHLEGASPFDRSLNWMRYFVEDGLPDASVSDIVVHEGNVWIGTANGLLMIPDDALAMPDTWKQFHSTDFDSLPPITALAIADDILYVGTQSGVYSYDLDLEQLTLIAGTDGTAVHDMALANETLYVASNRGLRGFRNGSGMGWLVLGEIVTSVAYANDTLYYGAGTDVVSMEYGASSSTTVETQVTALMLADEGVWVGTRASEDYEMTVWVLAESAYALSGSVTGISGANTSAYVDSLAAEHTSAGWIARGSFNHTADTFTLSGMVESRPPSFRSIGSSRRSDSTGWTLSGDIELGRQGSLQLDHDYRLTNQLSESPSTRMGNGLTFQWSFADGPELTATLRHVETDETDAWGTETVTELTSSFSVNESFFRDALNLDLSWNQNTSQSDRWNEQWNRQGLTLAFSWGVSDALHTSGSWSRPVRRNQDDVSGSETIKWDWDWNTSFSFADLDIEYSADWARALFAESGDLSHDAELRLDGEPFQIYGWELSPDLKLEGEHASTSTDLHAELVVRSEVEEFSVRTTIRGHLTNLGRPVYNREGELSLNAKYSGLTDSDISLTYTGSNEAAVKALESAVTLSHSIIGRWAWTPDEGPRDELSLSLRVKDTETARQITATLDNELTLNLATDLSTWLDMEQGEQFEGYPMADLRVDSKAEYRSGTKDPEFSFSTTGNLLVALAPRWNIAVGATYGSGYKTAIGLYHSILLELTFAIEF